MLKKVSIRKQMAVAPLLAGLGFVVILGAVTMTNRNTNKAAIQKAFHTTLEIEHASISTITVTTAVILVLLVTVAVYVTRSIVRPLEGAVRAAERVAAGDVSVEIAEGYGDEIGRL